MHWQYLLFIWRYWNVYTNCVSFLVYFYLIRYKKWRGAHNTEIQRGKTLVRFDPRPAGAHVGRGCVIRSQHIGNISVHPPRLIQVYQEWQSSKARYFGQLPTGGNSFSSSSRTGLSANSCSGKTSPFWAPPSSEYPGRKHLLLKTLVCVCVCCIFECPIRVRLFKGDFIRTHKSCGGGWSWR